MAGNFANTDARRLALSQVGAAGLHSLAFFGGTVLLDLINVLARPLVFGGALAWMVGILLSTSQQNRTHLMGWHDKIVTSAPEQEIVAPVERCLMRNHVLRRCPCMQATTGIW